MNPNRSLIVCHANIKEIKVNISKGKALGFVEDEQGIIRFQNRICVPQRMELKKG